MKFTIILFINLLLCSVAAKSYAGLQELFEVRRAFYTMGTTLEFNLVCSDKEHCLNIINSCIAEVRRIDKVFSNYRDDSELSMLQITADKKIKVSKEFFELTAFSHFISVLTNGGFDITVGPLVNLWKTDSFKNKIPKESVIKSALDRCVGFNKFNLSSADNSISFNSDCINLDFGAIGKGYVLERLAEILKKENIKSGIINFGGNIYAFGSDLDRKPWTVGIKDPYDNTGYINKIVAHNLSVSTSGGYERYFEINGKKYSHIIDPRTGYPVDHFSSVTIVSENPVFADALSTAFSVLSLKESIEIIKHLDKVGILLIEKKHGKVSKYNNDYFKRLSVN